ncbi:hypothetical protein [Burkholderia cenocepacia]|uniref:hypothetical protein n=1 Tax=Burkholderia cenocepacia TaxID=95486 RepID=UPI001365D757|nr:hypothetical protein [Burkholderia cenocepacia]
MNNDVTAELTRLPSIGCTGAQHAEILAFAKARGLEKEFFHVVVAEWKRSKLH